jgi:hypothetical protein
MIPNANAKVHIMGGSELLQSFPGAAVGEGSYVYNAYE